MDVRVTIESGQRRNIADFVDLIPDDDQPGMPTAAIRILRYIDKDGAPSISYEMAEEADDELIDWLGVLQWVQLQMFDRRYDPNEGPSA